MSAIDQIERELEDLRSRFSQAFQVLDNLAQLQTHFEHLTQTQQELEQSLTQAKERLQGSSLPSDLQEKYAELESQFEAKYTQLQSEVLDLRHSFEATTYDLQDQLHHDRTQIKQLEQSSGVVPGGDNNKMDWLENSMQDLSNLIYADRSALQHLDRRLNHVKRITDILTVGGGVLVFLVTVFIFVTLTR